MRHLTGGKHGQHSPLLKPFDRLSEGATIPLRRTRRVKGIHKDARALEFRHTLEEKIRHHLHVWPNTRQQHCKHGSIQHAVRMIGDNNHGALRGNASHVGGAHAYIDIHLAQQIFQNEPICRVAHSLIECVHLIERQQLAYQWQ